MIHPRGGFLVSGAREMLKRAYSLLEVKEVTEEEDAYVIRGMATTPTPDRVNDIVEPLGATFAAQIPLLWQHNAEKPVGITELGKPTKKGIPFVSRIPKVKEAGALRDRIEEAVQSIRYKLVAAVSIGFRVLNDAIERLQSGGYRFLETEILELSLVTIPAQPDAKITGIKSIDERLLAASGRVQRGGVALIKSPPASRETTVRKRGPVQLIPRNYDRGKEDSARSNQGS